MILIDSHNIWVFGEMKNKTKKQQQKTTTFFLILILTPDFPHFHYIHVSCKYGKIYASRKRVRVIKNSLHPTFI